jgi:hypothetical protein
MSASTIEYKLNMMTEGVSGVSSGTSQSWMPSDVETKHQIVAGWEQTVSLLSSINMSLLDQISTINTSHWQTPVVGGDTFTATQGGNTDPLVILEVCTTESNQKHKAKRIMSEAEFTRGLDSDSYGYADSTSPIYIQLGKVTKVLPSGKTPSLRYVQSLSRTVIDLTDTAFSSWMAANTLVPPHIERMALQFAAIGMLKWTLSHIMSKMPHDLGTLTHNDLTSFDTEAEINEVATILDTAINNTLLAGDQENSAGATTGGIDLTMKPTVNSADVWYNGSTGVFDQIDTNEDIELAAAKMQAISSKLNFITTGFNNYVGRLGAKQSEAQANTAKKATWYNARVQEINSRVQQIQLLIQKHEEDIARQVAVLAGTGPQKTNRVNEATKNSG